MEREVLPIFFAVDNKYIPFLAVTLQSLVDNASTKYEYLIKILYVDINEENKKKIKKYERENVNIEFVDLNYYIAKVKHKLYTRDYYTKSTYFRLFIPDLYPQYNKALYIDSDVVALADVADLYNVDMGNNLVAGVPDGAVSSIPVFQEYVEKVVGVASYKNYFNAGILVMNLDELRKFRFQEKFLYLLENIKYSVAQDQDYLNRLCKGRVKIVDRHWNVMPIQDKNIDIDKIKMLHFNLGLKPWHFEDILYSEYFWKYAERTSFLDDIKKEKERYTEEERFRDREKSKQLLELAQKEADCVGDDRDYREVNDTEEVIDKQSDRLRIMKKIELLEREGRFDEDVEDDPPTIPLTPDNIDYLKTKTTSKLKSRFATKMGEKYVNDLLKDNKLIIKEVRGIENLSQLESGAILTCNHFNPFDSFTIEKVFRMSGQNKHKKLYKVIREGNYTNFPGFYGFLFRNADTLPLSSNKRTMVKFMNAVDVLLENKNLILMYPEQSMWWNYEKPKPLKRGAFKLATRNNVPVIPIFITFKDSEIMGDDGFPVKEYYVNIGKAIYPEESFSNRENIDMMKKENFEFWKNIYEDFYETPLEYTTIKKEA